MKSKKNKKSIDESSVFLKWNYGKTPPLADIVEGVKRVGKAAQLWRIADNSMWNHVVIAKTKKEAMAAYNCQGYNDSIQNGRYVRGEGVHESCVQLWNDTAWSSDR